MENHANTETNFVWITRLPMYIYDCVCECDSVSSCLFLLFFIWPNVIEIVRWHCHLRLASNIFSRNKLLFSVDRNRFPMNNDYNTWCDLQFFDGSKCRPVSLPLALFQYALVLLFLLIFGTFEIHLSVFKMNDRITRVGHACHLLCSTLNKKTLNNVWTTVNGNTNDDSTNFSRSSKKKRNWKILRINYEFCSQSHTMSTSTTTTATASATSAMTTDKSPLETTHGYKYQFEHSLSRCNIFSYSACSLIIGFLYHLSCRVKEHSFNEACAR